MSHTFSGVRRAGLARRRNGLLDLTIVAALCVVALFVAAVTPAAAIPTGRTLDLRVLVISSGDAGTDLGRGLVVPMLDEVGVPYDVLDARTESLTADRLASQSAGRYNGIILTEAVLYDPGSPTGSAFTAGEWAILHDYERAFDVRESVISGFPGTYPQFGLDYGMTDIVAGAPFLGRWVPPAGVTTFEYVNTAHPLPITDYALNARPLQLYAGEPSPAPAAPGVEKLLVLDDDPTKTFVSILHYDDGREVLLSTITNASYLIHSQVLAYEFLSFATRGLFVGGRYAYLAAHADDLFIGDTMWNPATNRTDEDNLVRLTADGFTNAIAAQQRLRGEHPRAADFVVDFPFNGAGAQTARVPSVVVGSAADTYLKQREPHKNFGTDSAAEVNAKAGENERTLLRFPVPVGPNAPVTAAALTVYSDDHQVPVQLCPVSAAWDEGIKKDNQDANWTLARTGVPWATPGGDYDPSACVAATLPDHDFVTVDVTPIVASWASGARPNNGLVVVATDQGNARVKTREEGNVDKRPSLRVDFGSPTGPVTVPDLALGTAGDTYLRQNEPAKPFGQDNDAMVKLKGDGTDEKRALLAFDVPPRRLPAVATAMLDLYTEGALIAAKACPIVDTRWEQAGATWQVARAGVPWPAGPGGAYDAAECEDFQFVNNAKVQVDITSMVEQWQTGDLPNFGLVVIATSLGEGRIKTADEANEAKRPALRLSFQPLAPDGLTTAVQANADRFRYINHTLSHRDMDVSNGTSYDEARYDIELNRTAWDLLGLPRRTANDPLLISGDHSGLREDRGTDLDPTDDLPYPGARNVEFLRAASDAGVRYLGSDASLANQNVEAYVPGFEGRLLLLPRYPTSVFYNVTTPQAMTDEYNYLFYERFVDAGQNPCVIPGAICVPRTYQQILDAEADTTLRHILSYRQWPHFFHESNVNPYDAAGSTLLFDWLDAVLDRYEALLALPLKNLPYDVIAQQTTDRLAAAGAHVRGVLDLDTGQVTISADAPVRSLVTGVGGGELYGGQRIATLDVGPIPRTVGIDPAL